MDCERTVNCPYNVSHQISEERLQYHLVKCKRNHPWKENIHIFQVTKRATILESELDCEWNKVGGLIPLNPATLPPLDEDWNQEYVQSPLQNIDASDKPVFRNLPGATKSERKLFRREERCRFEKVIETMKQSEKNEPPKNAGKRNKQSKNDIPLPVEEYPNPDKGPEVVQENVWKSVKGRSRKRGSKKASREIAKVNSCSGDESRAGSSTSHCPPEEKQINETNDVQQLLVAFHDIDVSSVDNISNSSKNDLLKDDELDILPNDSQCAQHSVFQEWDKILIHDLPTTDSAYDICSPSTSFVDVLLRGPKEKIDVREMPISDNNPQISTEISTSQEPENDDIQTTSPVPKYYSSIAATSSTITGESRNDIKILRSRSAHGSASTSRERTPSTASRLAETKTYENYTNLNTILGRKSRKINKTVLPSEPPKSNASIDAINIESKNATHLANTIAGLHSTPSLESGSDSSFATRQDTTPFSYASILSKKSCSHI